MFYVESIRIPAKSNRPSLWQRFMRFTEIVGYSRAAARLAEMGYYKEARDCMMAVKRLK